jgi:hypothetical protein
MVADRLVNHDLSCTLDDPDAVRDRIHRSGAATKLVIPAPEEKWTLDSKSPVMAAAFCGNLDSIEKFKACAKALHFVTWAAAVNVLQHNMGSLGIIGFMGPNEPFWINDDTKQTFAVYTPTDERFVYVDGSGDFYARQLQSLHPGIFGNALEAFVFAASRDKSSSINFDYYDSVTHKIHKNNCLTQRQIDKIHDKLYRRLDLTAKPKASAG